MRLSSSIAFEEVKGHLVEQGATLPTAQQFFKLADFLLTQRRLTHCLVDQSRTQADRYQLYQRVNPLAGESNTVDQAMFRVLGHRIPDEQDLLQIFEELGLEALISALGSEAEIETVTDELFNVYEVLDNHHELRNVLGERKDRRVAERFALVDQLLGGQISEAALELVKRAVVVTARSEYAGADRASLSSRLRYYQNRLAESQGTILATVQTVQELSAEQRGRLTQILQTRYRKPVRLHTQIVPELIGGAQIQIGAEIYDGTLSSALQKTKQKVAG